MKELSKNAINYLQINKLTKALRFSYFSTPIDFVEDQLLQIETFARWTFISPTIAQR